MLAALRPSPGSSVEAYAYHDLSRLPGLGGIAVVRGEVQDDHRMAAACFSDPSHGRNAMRFRLPVGQDVAAWIRAVREDSKLVLPGDERYAWRELFPGPDDDRAQARQARAVLRRADLPYAMIDALKAMLDHGILPLDLDLAKLRRQARDPLWALLAMTCTHPFLATVALQDSKFVKAIERGEGIVSALGHSWPGATGIHVRRMEGFRCDMPGMTFEGRFKRGRAVLSAITSCPPDWVPSDASAIEDLCDVACIAELATSDTNLTLSDLLRPARGDWTRYLASLSAGEGLDPAAGRDDNVETLETRALDAWDAPGHLSKTLLRPLLMHEEARRNEAGLPCPWSVDNSFPGAIPKVCVALLYGGKGLQRVLEVSAEWHRAQEGIEATSGVTAGRSWEPPFDPVTVGDILVLPLCDGRSLVDEGSAGADGNGALGMSHCIATRIDDFADGLAHALSIRRVLADGRYERISTAQVEMRFYVHMVKPDASGWVMDIEEHRGPGNAEPSGEAWDAIADVAGGIATGAIPVRPDASTQRGRDKDKEREVMGDWRDPAYIARMMAAWRPLLPRWFRDLGPEAACDALEARGMLGHDGMRGVVPQACPMHAPA